jgi:hypothetical protein
MFGAAPLVGVGPVASAEDTEEALPDATVTDEFGIEMQVKGAGIYEAASGFLSSGKPKLAKEIRLWKGAHQIVLKLQNIAEITVTDNPTDGDLIELKIKLRGGEAVEGKIERGLELRGELGYGEYKILLGRTKRVVFN